MRRPYKRSLLGSIFGCVVWSGVLLFWGVVGSVLGCLCRICYSIYVSHPIGCCRSCVFGLCVCILELGMCSGYFGCLTRLVVLVLLSLLRGRCVDCIWGGVGVG